MDKDFIVVHYAGEACFFEPKLDVLVGVCHYYPLVLYIFQTMHPQVRYTVDGFVENNMETLSNELRELWRALRYFYSLICCSDAGKVTLLIPIQTEFLFMLKNIRSLSVDHQSKFLRREIRYFEGLYWATRESAIASLIFFSACFEFAASVTCTVTRIFDIRLLENLRVLLHQR
jgi:hypothetical protein